MTTDAGCSLSTCRPDTSAAIRSGAPAPVVVNAAASAASAAYRGGTGRGTARPSRASACINIAGFSYFEACRFLDLLQHVFAAIFTVQLHASYLVLQLYNAGPQPGDGARLAEPAGQRQ